MGIRAVLEAAFFSCKQEITGPVKFRVKPETGKFTGPVKPSKNFGIPLKEYAIIHIIKPSIMNVLIYR